MKVDTVRIRGGPFDFRGGGVILKTVLQAYLYQKNPCTRPLLKKEFTHVRA